MLFSKACTYAIRASILISLKDMKEKRKFIPIHELSDELHLSFHFLTKIMQLLTEAKLLESFKGPKGGVGFVKPANKIMLLDVVSAVDGLDLFTECAMGLPGCGESTPCPLHNAWAKRRADLMKMLSTTTLASLALNIEVNRLRN